MRHTLFFLLLAVPVLSFAQLTGVPDTDGMEGHWTGVGLQIDKQQWDIDLRIISDAEVLISYPSLGCSGHWELVQNGKRKRHYKEVIETGLLNCDQGGDVFIKKVSRNKLRVTYYLYSYSEEPIAKAMLQRQHDKTETY
ncbi:MAG: hypothetical protein H6548_11645 [Chitinophagales bacterium]|nr:hypothetical protein [Chitinophagales bacterium]HAE34222.1 hypothetical protein [Bacteroidota bacterium]HPE98708.1 hypothetical protein [Chitinophagales bacterium]HPR28859.1 hypothetical protein [Chitinophagales bacterium]HQU40397.1 hypothetical protein [Chitinophagales bacterium]